MTRTKHTEVTVIGAGISGLSTAFFLNRAGVDVRVIEKQPRTGGTIETGRKDGFLIDYGPNSGLETTPFLGELFDGAGVSSSLCYANKAARNRYIVKSGALHPLPINPAAFIRTPLFSPRSKLRLLKEPFIGRVDGDHDESLADFVRRRLGNEFLDYAINPFVSGVYAGTPEHLSVKSGFPKLYELEQRHGSLIKGALKGARERRRKRRAGETSRASARMFSFTGGMQTITDALSDALGDRVSTGASVLAIERTRGGYDVHLESGGEQTQISTGTLIFAIPAHAYSNIRFDFEFDILNRLDRIPYPPVGVVFFGYRDNPSPRPLDGFGFLIPEKEKRGSLGTIWSSSLFSGRAPEGGVALTTFVGGARQPENARLADDEMVSLVRRDTRDLLGIERPPDVAVVRRWERAIPQYNVGHSHVVGAIEEFERRNPGLHISGNFRGGVSISDCVREAHALAERVCARRRETTPA